MHSVLYTYRKCAPKAAQILLISVTWFCSAGGHDSVITESPKLASYFGTKTRYEEVNPFLLANPLLVTRKHDLLPNTCTPLQIVSVIRHGTRYPTKKQIEKLKKMHSLIEESTSNSELVKELQSWDMWYEDWMDGQLVKKGEEDMKNLAYRLASLFPSLFTSDKFHKCKMSFTTSSKHRCVDSTKAFISGLAHTYLKLRPPPEDELESKSNLPLSEGCSHSCMGPSLLIWHHTSPTTSESKSSKTIPLNSVFRPSGEVSEYTSIHA